MNKFIGIVSLVGIFFMMIMMLAFNNYSQKARMETKNVHLTYAVDYATDAAVDALLDSPDLGMDYGTEGKIELDPNKALDVFVDTFLLNYGLPASAQNRELVRSNYMPVFVVATYDGYYMASLENVKSAVDAPENAPIDIDQTLIFYPKMSYKYVNGGVSYALNFGAKDYLSISGSTMAKGTGYPPGLNSKEEVLAEINKVISTDIAYRIETLNELNPNYANSFFIPSGLTNISRTNLLEGPSVIAIVQNVDLDTVRPISGFSIGGGKIDGTRYVVGYQRLGIGYYAYADQVPAVTIVEQVFASMKEAAVSGYYPDLLYLQN